MMMMREVEESDENRYRVEERWGRGERDDEGEERGRMKERREGG